VSATSCAILFTKPAVPGRVKTRLIPHLSPQRAAELHAAFQEDAIQRLSPGSYDLHIAWDLAAAEAIPSIPGCPGFRQEGEDLGARLFHALSVRRERYRQLAVVGSDLPGLGQEHIMAAFQGLGQGAEVVLGPAADGGYFLLALRSRALERRLFDGIAWSTESVLESTLQRCEELSLATMLLPVGHDVDTPADLEHLIERFGAGEVESPRTAAVLRAWGFLDSQGEDLS
jgi:rSAM/selenodomain-associated transferase 1